ncbi:MAG: hypothetical protein RSB25_23120, partial [Acinetobacter sp.]
MSDFEEWFRSLNANGKTVYFLGNEHKVSEMAWNHQQAIIDNLKTQLNNMEACYIEKKKQVEELRGQIYASKSSQPKLHKTEIGDCLHFSTTMFHDGKA